MQAIPARFGPCIIIGHLPRKATDGSTVALGLSPWPVGCSYFGGPYSKRAFMEVWATCTRHQIATANYQALAVLKS